MTVEVSPEDIEKPKRRFAPEAIETSTRSSKQQTEAIELPSRPRKKFAVEPVESTSRSSKQREASPNAETSPKQRRKFAAEPFETSQQSSKNKAEASVDVSDSVKPKKRFAVEPVDVTTRSSKDKNNDENSGKPKRKFAVQPIESTTISSKSRPKADRDSDEEQDSGYGSGAREIPSRSNSGGRRKFAPEVVETARGSFRKKSEALTSASERSQAQAQDEQDQGPTSDPSESKFSSANLARRARADPRRHSYVVPDLPKIQSDSSEEDSDDDMIDSPAEKTRKKALREYGIVAKRPLRHRGHHPPHTIDEHTLRDDAIHAYMQEESNVRFDHYGAESDSDDQHDGSTGRISVSAGAGKNPFRRMSFDDLDAVKIDFQSHHSQFERAKKDFKEDTAGISRFSAAALAARHHLGIHHPNQAEQANGKHDPTVRDLSENKEFNKIRKAASPPMGGDDLKFPFSISPKMTRCDVDQVPRPRRHNSDDNVEEHDIGDLSLWSSHISAEPDAPSGLWGGTCAKKSSPPASLWGGLCVQDPAKISVRLATPTRSGLQTPAFEGVNPFESQTPGRKSGARTPRTKQFAGGLSAFMPLTPPRSKNERATPSKDAFVSALDEKLALERQIDDEFPPRVITQIYNYLSLGYPPLARPFDEELSKISRITLIELRRSDRSDTGNVRGFIGSPEGEGDYEEDEEGRVKGCRRWDALRLYVREWARQSPGFRNEKNGFGNNVAAGAWGNHAPVRKGSWGF